jgi:hypothetical protein
MKNSITKKTFLFLTFVSLTSVFGQVTPTKTTTTTVTTSISTETDKPSIFIKTHELKIGAIKLLAVPALEGTYEFVKNKNYSYGVALLINIGDKEELSETFALTPFGRFYFQETQEYGSKGLFVEGFARIANVNYYQNYDYWFYSPKDLKNYTQFAIGFCIGKKWVNSSGFVFEIMGGAGRSLNAPTDAPNIIGRGDVNVGYRF